MAVCVVSAHRIYDRERARERGEGRERERDFSHSSSVGDCGKEERWR